MKANNIKKGKITIQSSNKVEVNKRYLRQILFPSQAVGKGIKRKGFDRMRFHQMNNKGDPSTLTRNKFW